MSYNIVTGFNDLSELVNFIQASYPYYNKKELRDDKTGDKYTVQMIDKSINKYVKLEKILKVIIFDALIGNSDRHHSNIGFLQVYHQNELMFGGHPYVTTELAPLYDNGSSLCSYVDNETAICILKDKMRFNALIDTKSKSTIGWKDKRPIRHFELIKYISDEYYDETKEYIIDIYENINEKSISSLLNEFNNDIISNNIKELLYRYILERKNKIIEIYDRKC